MTAVALALLDGIDEDAVDFRATYDGEENEPIVLPAAFPNLLANGSTGIAVGMATNIPPHNVAELCDALIHLNRVPNATIEKLVVPGAGAGLPARAACWSKSAREYRRDLSHRARAGSGSGRAGRSRN